MGDPLEVGPTQVDKHEAGPADQEAGHHVGAEDLSGFSPITQPAGHNDGEPEIVRFVVLKRFTGVDADTDRQLLTVDRPAGRPLHCQRA
ncbi:MAG TPA: hypothetical protein VK848_08470, partial [Acidimicrobiia bacterium]|nr:hypothetical protein [Acidimicrobiia bacterium]